MVYMMQIHPDSETTINQRTAVVTGGATGIGRSICIALAAEGCHVSIIDLDRDKAQETANFINASGGEATVIIGSVGDHKSVRQMFAAIVKNRGGIDILVNNAGVSGNRPTLELTEEDWNKTITINQGGVFFCCQQAGLIMSKQAGGVIVNIGSIFSLVAAPNRIHYCASKAAVAMMTKSLAVEWARYNIRVNCVAPGYVETALIRELEDEGRLSLSDIRARIPQKRLATTEDIAHAVLGFCDPRNSHITGQVLAVDGGWSAYGYV
jgi:NAD(P)-dependent dehydrogenase (short-subunit alcohol dehydrogenase family)